jgi:AcrR family transcriptional regulator
MGRPRAEDVTTSTRQRLLEAAEQEFAEVGFEAAKLAAIAARAGIRRPSLLYHFKTKEDLYAATVERAFSQLGVALAASMAAAGDFEARVLATVANYARFVADNPDVARIVLRETVHGVGPGGDIVLRQLVPLVDAVEHFVDTQGQGSVPEGTPVRAAILTIASALLVRSAAGALREPLWRDDDDHAQALGRALFLGGPR